jgi:hypothetical protein
MTTSLVFAERYIIDCATQPNNQIAGVLVPDRFAPHWLRCDQCGKDVAEVLPAEALDLVSLTARHLAELCPEAAQEIDAHMHG